MGIRPEYAGLRIDPVVLAAWRDFTATRRFRGATYLIRVDNHAGVQRGVQAIRVDGQAVDPNEPLPVATPDAEVRVDVTLG